MLAKKIKIGQIGVLTGNAGDRFAGRLVRVVNITPAYYTVEFVRPDATGWAHRKNVFNAEIRFLENDKEIFVYMLKEPV